MQNLFPLRRPKPAANPLSLSGGEPLPAPARFPGREERPADGAGSADKAHVNDQPVCAPARFPGREEPAPVRQIAATPAHYRTAARLLLRAIGTDAFFSGSIAFRCEGVQCRLAITLVVRRDEPDAHSRWVPVWWEFHTVDEVGERSNDFSFKELLPCLDDGCR